MVKFITVNREWECDVTPLYSKIRSSLWGMQSTNATSEGCSLPFEKRPTSFKSMHKLIVVNYYFIFIYKLHSDNNQIYPIIISVMIWTIDKINCCIHYWLSYSYRTLRRQTNHPLSKIPRPFSHQRRKRQLLWTTIFLLTPFINCTHWWPWLAHLLYVLYPPIKMLLLTGEKKKKLDSKYFSNQQPHHPAAQDRLPTEAKQGWAGQYMDGRPPG